MSSLGDAFAPAEAAYAARVMWETWGHPEPNVKYPGVMVFTCSETGDLVVIKSDFPTLDGGPWFYMDANDFVSKAAKEEGEIYKFVGTYTKFNNGNYRFSGKITRIVIEMK